MADDSMIAAGDVRRLLDAGEDAVLVVLAGRAEVVEPAELRDETHRGALEVISRAELIRQAGSERLSDDQLVEQAAALDTAVTELGG